MKGKPIDDQTRCVHYHTDKDVIAIRFKCCGEFYPCYACHAETAGHNARGWPKAEWDSKAILCGVCNNELTINEYLTCGDECPNCKAQFNPNCSLHYGLYFEY